MLKKLMMFSVFMATTLVACSPQGEEESSYNNFPDNVTVEEADRIYRQNFLSPLLDTVDTDKHKCYTDWLAWVNAPAQAHVFELRKSHQETGQIEEYNQLSITQDDDHITKLLEICPEIYK